MKHAQDWLLDPQALVGGAGKRHAVCMMHCSVKDLEELVCSGLALVGGAGKRHAVCMMHCDVKDLEELVCSGLALVGGAGKRHAVCVMHSSGERSRGVGMLRIGCWTHKLSLVGQVRGMLCV